jgi:hypothetical protein
MPHFVNHHVRAELVRVGDVIVSDGGDAPAEDRGGIVGNVTTGRKYVVAHDVDGYQLFRVERDVEVIVARSELTDAEKEAARQAYLDRQADENHHAMLARFPKRLLKLQEAVAAGQVPSTDLLTDVWYDERLYEYGQRVARGLEVHAGTKTLRELHALLYDEVLREVLRGQVGRWSGGFTLNNAREQTRRDADLDVLRALDENDFYTL